MKWAVKVNLRKRNPDMTSERVRVGRRVVPKDSVPVPQPTFVVTAPNHDRAREKVKAEVTRRGFCVASLSFSAENKNQIVVHVIKEEEDGSS